MKSLEGGAPLAIISQVNVFNESFEINEIIAGCLPQRYDSSCNKFTHYYPWY